MIRYLPRPPASLSLIEFLVDADNVVFGRPRSHYTREATESRRRHIIMHVRRLGKHDPPVLLPILSNEISPIPAAKPKLLPILTNVKRRRTYVTSSLEFVGGTAPHQHFSQRIHALLEIS